MTDLPSDEIQDLLNRIACGEHERASAHLYRHYCVPLTRYLWFRLLDEHSAREIAHETLKVAIANPMKFNGTSKYSTWLIGIAVKLVQAHQRQQGRMAARRVEDSEECLATLAADDPEPFVAMSQAQINRNLALCMSGLGEAYREVVALHYTAEKNITEVAATLGIPAGTVKSRLNKARTLLKSCLARKNITGMDS